MFVQNLSASEQKAMRRFLSQPHKAIFDLGVSSGLRISDILILPKSVLDIREPTIKEIKTGKSRRFYIPTKTRTDLARIATCSPNALIFGANNKCGHLTRQAVYKAFKKASSMANIKKNIGTHSMRKSYAVKKASHGLKFVQSKLNHSHLADTLLYILER